MARGRLGAPYGVAIGNLANATADVKVFLVGEAGPAFRGRHEARDLGRDRACAGSVPQARTDRCVEGRRPAADAAPGAKELHQQVAQRELSKDEADVRKGADTKVQAASDVATRGAAQLPQPVVRRLPAGEIIGVIPFVVRPDRQIWLADRCTAG